MKICFEGKRRIKDINKEGDEADGYRNIPSVPAAPQVLEAGALLIWDAQYGRCATPKQKHPKHQSHFCSMLEGRSEAVVHGPVQEAAKAG